MKLLGIFFFCSASATLLGQNQPVQLWQSVEYVKSINIKGPTITTDKFQNTYMLTNQTDESPFSGFTLVKYDTAGNVAWKRHSQIGIIGILYGSFTVDSTGNVYVGQWYDGGLPGYDADAVLFKYSPDGVKQWEANYGLNQAGDSYIYYSELDTLNGRLITLGMNWHDTIPAENFMFVQAVDTSDGGVVWRTEIPGVFYPQNLRVQSNHIQLLSTQYKPDRNYFVNTLVGFDGGILTQYEKPYSGYRIDINYISKTGDVIFGNRAFGYNVTRVDVQGDTLWAYSHPLNSGTNKNWVRFITEDALLNIYTTGVLEITGNNVEMTTSKININGELVWQDIFHSFDGDFGDSGENVKICKDIIITSGATQLENSDVVGLIKLYNIENGFDKCDILIKNENIFVINEIILWKDKIFYVSEGYQSNINNMVAVTGCFSIPKISSAVNSIESTNPITTFPNPTTGFIFVSDIDTNIFYEISVIDVNGKIIINKKIETTQEKIILSDFPPGLYTVCVYGKNLQINKKIVTIQHD